MKEKYSKAKPFELESEKRPTNLNRLKAEAEENLQKVLQFDKKYCGPITDFSKAPAEIKYNETAILRENLTLLKKRKEEEAALERIILEKKDTKDFEIWQKEMEEKDNIKRLEEIAKRKIMSDLSKENTVDIKNKKIVENQLAFIKQKEEEAIKLDEKYKMLQEEVERKAVLCKEMYKERVNINAGKEVRLQKKTQDYYTQMAVI